MNKQTGSALILSLLILLVMTMLGITAMSTSTLEEKMAANDRNQKIAFQNAELTLGESEIAILQKDWRNTNSDKEEGTNIVDKSANLEKLLNDPNNKSFYGLNEAKADYFEKTTWQADSCVSASDNNQSGFNACYIVEYIADQNPIEVGGGYGQANQSNVGHKILKLTARSTDSNNVTASIVQSTIRKKFIFKQ